MGQYFCGDVLLASVALDDRQVAKTRPVVVVGVSGTGELRVCPVSSKPPSDAPSVPLSIDDFSSGGLDLFSESFVMTSRVVTLAGSSVIGKKGRLLDDYLDEVTLRTRENAAIKKPGTERGKKPRRGR